jgi:hypothetical protein
VQLAHSRFRYNTKTYQELADGRLIPNCELQIRLGDFDDDVSIVLKQSHKPGAVAVWPSGRPKLDVSSKWNSTIEPMIAVVLGLADVINRSSHGNDLWFLRGLLRGEAESE